MKWIKLSKENPKLPQAPGNYICILSVMEGECEYQPISFVRFDAYKKEFVCPNFLGTSGTIIQWLDESEPLSDGTLEERAEAYWQSLPTSEGDASNMIMDAYIAGFNDNQHAGDAGADKTKEEILNNCRGKRGAGYDQKYWDAALEAMEIHSRHFVEALVKIAEPIAFLQKEAKEEGCQLNGQMAIQLSNDPNWLKGIAKTALSNYNAQSTPTPTVIVDKLRSANPYNSYEESSPLENSNAKEGWNECCDTLATLLLGGDKVEDKKEKC